MAISKKKRARKGQSKSRYKNNFEKLDRALEVVLDDYFKVLAGHNTDRLHRLVFSRVEKKLLAYVLQFTAFNQGRTAGLLGISRSTLRSKIRAYGLVVKKESASAPKKI